MKRKTIDNRMEIMNHIDNVILDYVKAPDTDYAIMIDGQWGAGKSFYWRHTAKPMIEALTFADNEHYKAVKISLFGIQSIDDLKVEIYAPFLADKNVKKKKWTELGGHALSFIAKKIGLQDNKKVLASVMSVLPINIKHRVFCFDDLERLNPNIMMDVLGYINSLIEEHHIKVILICNGDKNEVPGYAEYKEKLVRFTCKIEPDISLIVRSSVEGREKNYSDFIKTNSEWIGNVYKRAECNNIRTLIFNLDIIERIYPIVQANMGKVEWNVREYVLLLTMAYSIESRKKADNPQIDLFLNLSQLWVNHISFIENLSVSHSSWNEDEKQKDLPEDEKYLRDIRNRYFKNTFIYGVSKSLLEYIQTGKLDEGMLKNEVSNMAIEAQHYFQTDDQKLMSKLGNFWDVDDNEMEKAITDVIDGTKQMRFPMAYYPNYFLRLQRLQNFGFGETGYSVPELKKLFLKAIEECPKNGYVEQLNGIYQNTDGATSEFTELAEKVYDINNSMRNEEHGDAFKEAILHLDADSDLKQFWNLPVNIFSGISAKDFLDSFISCHNSRKRDVYDFMEKRYECQSHRDYDSAFISELTKTMNAYLSDRNVKPSPSRKYCEHLLKVLKNETTA